MSRDVALKLVQNYKKKKSFVYTYINALVLQTLDSSIRYGKCVKDFVPTLNPNV